MPDEKDKGGTNCTPIQDTRPWYWKTRVQGIMLVGVGGVMLAFQVPYADKVIEAGFAWMIAGANAKYTRDKMSAPK